VPAAAVFAPCRAGGAAREFAARQLVWMRAFTTALGGAPISPLIQRQMHSFPAVRRNPIVGSAAIPESCLPDACLARTRQPNDISFFCAKNKLRNPATWFIVEIWVIAVWRAREVFGLSVSLVPVAGNATHNVL
jgi:hypothetical protein